MTTEHTEPDLSTQTIAEYSPARQPSDKLVRLAEASGRLGLSVWTLKRLHAKGDLPLVRPDRDLFVPESFIDMVFAAMRPGHAPDFAEVAKAWFKANAEAVA